MKVPVPPTSSQSTLSPGFNPIRQNKTFLDTLPAPLKNVCIKRNVETAAQYLQLLKEFPALKLDAPMPRLRRRKLRKSKERQ